MSSVASKNLFDVLGNDPEGDPELRTDPAPTVEPVEQPTQRKGKRNAGQDAPAAQDGAANVPQQGNRNRDRRGGGRGGRGRGDFGGNEAAFQDADAGRTRNRDKPADEAREDRHPNRLRGGRGGRGATYDVRGSRGGRTGRGGYRDDRHSKGIHQGGPNDQQKQAEHGWGEATGDGEWADEKAGEAQAQEEQKQGFDEWVEVPANAEGEAPVPAENAGDWAEEPAADAEQEPEDKTKSYADYLAEQAAKKEALGGNLTARKANEGTGAQPEGTQLQKEDAQYFAGSGQKARRESERKEKNLVLLDHDIQARDQPSFRGGRGGGRGRGRGEGGFRGERGEGRGRGGRGRGEFRGGRGGRGGATSPNVTNESDFPSLGA